MNEPILDFGEHEGKTLPAVIFRDPGYIAWLANSRDGGPRCPILRRRFEELYQLGSSLRLPGECRCGQPLDRMVLTPSRTNRLAVVEVACSACARDLAGGRSVVTRPSFFVSDTFSPYDKAGAKELIRRVKWCYFGDPRHRMTQSRLESFFTTAENFESSAVAEVACATVPRVRRFRR